MNQIKKQHGFSYAKYGYLFSIPFILAFLIFNLYPTLYTVVLGFTDSKGLGNITFHILKDDPWKNFRAILKAPTFILSLKNTFVLWMLNCIPQITLALILTAWFTSRRNKIRGQGFFKVVMYLPNIITAASVAVLFLSSTSVLLKATSPKVSPVFKVATILYIGILTLIFGSLEFLSINGSTLSTNF